MLRNYLTGITRSLVRTFSIPAPTPWDSFKDCTLDSGGKESDYCEHCPHLRKIREKKLKNVSEGQKTKPREDNMKRGLVPEE